MICSSLMFEKGLVLLLIHLCYKSILLNDKLYKHVFFLVYQSNGLGKIIFSSFVVVNLQADDGISLF